MSAPPELLVEVHGPVATVTLNRPEARNALHPELVRRIGETVAELDARDDVAAIVLTGTDPAFCAGYDLRRLSSEDRSDQMRRQEAALGYVGPFPPHATPVIGAVNGPAVTGGLELALGCDFLIASERARFADTHARVGAMPGMGLTIRLPQLIGPDRARRMSLTGDFVDAATAQAWGLVTEVVPHGELLARAREVARHIAEIPAANIAEIRDTYDEIATLAGERAWARESERARAWFASRFDQQRLEGQREEITRRGRDVR